MRIQDRPCVGIVIALYACKKQGEVKREEIPTYSQVAKNISYDKRSMLYAILMGLRNEVYAALRNGGNTQ